MSIQSDYLNGTNIADLAKNYHVSTRTVYRITKSLRKPQHDSYDYYMMMVDWNSLMPASEIAEKYGYSNSIVVYAIIARLRKRGWAFHARRYQYVKPHRDSASILPRNDS